MGSPKDLNEPDNYAEALVQAVLLDRHALAAWLADDEGIIKASHGKWYLYFADRLKEMAPYPDQGFQARPRKAVAAPKLGRNEPCPCGSGKKYKQCHLLTGEEYAWKLGSPTPEIRALSVANLISRLSPEVLEKVPKDKCSMLALTEMSMTFYQYGRLKDAIALLGQALVNPERDDSQIILDYWIARYAEWLLEDDRFKEAESFLMDEFDAKRGVEGWQVAQKLAALYLDQGDPDNAEIWVNNALEGDPDNPFNHYLKGLLFHTLENWDEAVAAYERSNELSSMFREQERGYMVALLEDALKKARQHLPPDDGEEGEEEETP